MRILLLIGFILISTACSSLETIDARVTSETASKTLLSPLQQKKWFHGAVDCESNTEPSIEVFSYDQSSHDKSSHDQPSYILRQNKCVSFEAPFIYLLFGENKVLLLDTGATEDDLDFPLYQTVQSLIEKQSQLDGKTTRQLIVLHSHSHGDHYSGDTQFQAKANVTLVEPNYASMTEYFGFNQWPNGEAKIELGGRQVIIIPTPGHQEEAIAVYDPQTKWLLTGDTFYPGVLYIKHWNDFKQSINRLVSFSKTHPISAILGAHIEMTNKAGEYYPIGSIYQPNEASLVLTPQHLIELDSTLITLDEPNDIIFNQFIVAPMSGFQKTLSNIARWIIQ